MVDKQVDQLGAGLESGQTVLGKRVNEKMSDVEGGLNRLCYLSFRCPTQISVPVLHV